jgi:hypothetical protein
MVTRPASSVRDFYESFPCGGFEGTPFKVHRTLWNWNPLAGFKGRALTYVGYESPLASPLHGMKTRSKRVAGCLRSA